MRTHYTWIATNEALQQAIPFMHQAPYLAIDTEFERTTTYWPTLSLIQLAWGNNVWIIDALSPSINLFQLKEIFLAPKPVKVFHGARQDLEIFYRLYGALPGKEAVFDTQLAAMACYFLDYPSYERLCQLILDKKIDKSFQRTNWLKRPLRPEEIAYAVGDVTHLCHIYDYLEKKLTHLDRRAWIEEEKEILLNQDTYHFNATQFVQKLKFSGEQKSKQRLYHLLMWRENEAQKCNIPREHVLKNSTLIDIACKMPPTLQGLKKLISPYGRVDEVSLFNFLQTDLKENKLPMSWPQNEEDSEPAPSLLNLENKNFSQMLKLLAYCICKQSAFSQSLLSPSSRVFDQLALLPQPAQGQSKLLTGWRYDIFGQWAIRFKRGEILLGMKGEEIYFHTLTN